MYAPLRRKKFDLIIIGTLGFPFEDMIIGSYGDFSSCFALDVR
jgi:hypothetical protein